MFAIYKEIGHDLTITMAALASDADKAADTFTVTVASVNLAEALDYPISGYSAETVRPVNGTFTLTLTNGSAVTIQSLPNNGVNPYSVTEALSAGYALTNVTINGFAPLAREEMGVQTFLEQDKAVAFTNIKAYTVEFDNADGTVLSSTPYFFGTAAEDIATPAASGKAMDAENIYRFTMWTPSLEAVASNTVYTAAYRAIRIPNAMQRVANTNITVALPDEATLLSALARAGIDLLAEDYSEAAATALLNSRDPNSLRRWENLVSGTGTNTLLLSTAVNATSSNMTFRLSVDPALPANLGYTVLHELRKHTASGWTRVCEISDREVPTFPLDSEDATGYYRIYMLIIPNSNSAITNVIPTRNIVGVLRIASTTQHTMAAVPFNELPRDPSLDEPMKVEHYVGNGFVKDGDIVRLREDGTFKVWAVKNGKFEPYMSVNVNGVSVEVAGAAEAELLPGRAVWVTREDHSKPFTIIGQFTGKAVTNEVAGATTDASGKSVIGATMIANPRLSALKINDIDWGDNPADGDTIEIPPTVDGALSTRLKWYPKLRCWGGMAPTLTWNPVTFMFDVAIPTNFEIPAGMGFWYYRASGSGFSVTVKAEENLD